MFQAVLTCQPAAITAKTVREHFYSLNVPWPAPKARTLRDLDGALHDLNRAIELKPDEAQFHKNRGKLKEAKGDIVGATADFKRGLELNPGSAEAGNNLADGNSSITSAASSASNLTPSRPPVSVPKASLKAWGRVTDG